MAIEAGVRIRAPEFPSKKVWLNSPPLRLSALKGKVVLVDIWDYTCINCVRTLPYLREWHRRYAPSGLVIVGVHTPEFEFAQARENVEAAIAKFAIPYPVVLDNDYEIWNLYANQYWPRKFLIDRSGYIVYDHVGEGGYEETERAIQKHLKEASGPDVPTPEPFEAPGAVESGGVCYRATPELYLGYERGRLGNVEGFKPGKVVTYRDTGDYMDSYVYVNGMWLNRPQSLKHGRIDRSNGDYVALKYHAMSVNAVIRHHEGFPYRVYVLQDGSPVEPGDRGDDLRSDGDGRTYLAIEQSRMYQVIRNRSFGEHTLKLSSDSDQFELFSFTFGSCAAT